MSRYINVDTFIADMQERYCKPCKEDNEDYNGVGCRECWIACTMSEMDEYGDNGIDIVQCKECKYKQKCRKVVEHITHELTSVTIGSKSVEFCSYGEREGETMSKDIIYREDAIKAINLRAIIPHDVASAQYANMAINAIRSVPSADRLQGVWTNAGILTVHCSNCKSEFHELEAMNYCPNCGADMRGV